jgi:hypothetical protein
MANKWLVGMLRKGHTIKNIPRKLEVYTPLDEDDKVAMMTEWFLATVTLGGTCCMAPSLRGDWAADPEASMRRCVLLYPPCELHLFTIDFLYASVSVLCYLVDASSNRTDTHIACAQACDTNKHAHICHT